MIEELCRVLYCSETTVHEFWGIQTVKSLVTKKATQSYKTVTLAAFETHESNSVRIHKPKMIQRGKMVVFWTLILIVHLEGFFCQPLLFKRTSASTSLLSNAVHFVASSRIECSLDCLYKTGHYSCMAFAYNETEGVCTCGKRRMAPPGGTSPGGAAIHTNVDCSIAKRGWYHICCQTIWKKKCLVCCWRFDCPGD